MSVPIITRVERPSEPRRVSRAAANTSEPSAPVALVPDSPLRPRRQPRWIAIGVLLTCLGGLGSAVLYQQSTTVTDVVVVARPVSRGEVIKAGDLGTAQVGALNGVSSVPAGSLPGLVGQQALVDLSPGLLPANSVGAHPLPDGRVQLGLRLPPGRVPSGDLPPGTPVRLVAVPPPGSQGGDTAEDEGQAIQAVVLTRPVLAPDQTSWLTDVHVSDGDADKAATWAAGDRVALVREG